MNGGQGKGELANGGMGACDFPKVCLIDLVSDGVRCIGFNGDYLEVGVSCVANFSIDIPRCVLKLHAFFYGSLSQGTSTVNGCGQQCLEVAIAAHAGMDDKQPDQLSSM